MLFRHGKISVPNYFKIHQQMKQWSTKVILRDTVTSSFQPILQIKQGLYHWQVYSLLNTTVWNLITHIESQPLGFSLCIHDKTVLHNTNHQWQVQVHSGIATTLHFKLIYVQGFLQLYDILPNFIPTSQEALGHFWVMTNSGTSLLLNKDEISYDENA